jgi:hypothetical protein
MSAPYEIPGPRGDTEEDLPIEVAGDEVRCLAKFEDGHLYSVKKYNPDYSPKGDEPMFIGDLMPFLTEGAIEDIEEQHVDQWREHVYG